MLEVLERPVGVGQAILDHVRSHARSRGFSQQAAAVLAGVGLDRSDLLLVEELLLVVVV